MTHTHTRARARTHAHTHTHILSDTYYRRILTICYISRCFPFTEFIYSYATDEAFQNATATHNSTYCDTSIPKMESKYFGFSLPVKAIAFIPSLAAFVAFVVLIIIYGRVKPTKSNPYVGRMVKVPKTAKPTTSMFTIVKMKLMRKKLDTESAALEETAGKFEVKGEDGQPLPQSGSTV